MLTSTPAASNNLHAFHVAFPGREVNRGESLLAYWL